MSEDVVKGLRDALALKQKQLDLIMAIDGIRDSVPEPEAMLTSLVELLAERLEAQSCMMFLVDRATGAIEPKAVCDPRGTLSALHSIITRDLAEEAVGLEGVTLWDGAEKLPDSVLADLPANLQLAAAPIVIGTDERLGALVLVRGGTPFGRPEVELLATAEDQIDSAVVQAYLQTRHERTLQEVSRKQRELDLIMAIDEIRDRALEPEAMLKAIAGLLAERLETELCMLFVRDRDTGALQLGAVSDRGGRLGHLQPAITQGLADEALGLEGVALWSGEAKLPAETLADLPAALQLMAAPIIIGREERLGALVLARLGAPYGEGEAQLLATAEDQVDSAVVQAYMATRHQQTVEEMRLRRRELDLIRRIDEIRDSASEPGAMLTSLVDLVAERLEAELCMIFLLGRETDGVELKAVSDRSGRLCELQPIITRELAEEAVALEGVTLWEGREKLPSGVLANLPADLQLAAVPIIIGSDERLGALLLARCQRRFSDEDVRLLRTAEDQVDSAVVQGYVQEKHQSTVNEVETIYQVDRLRDQGLPFDDMLNRVIQILTEKIHAEMGFIMLFDRSGKKLEMRASSHQDLLGTWLYSHVIERVIEESLHKATLICRNDDGDEGVAVMCLPLILNERIIGVLGVANRVDRLGFTAADCRLLRAIGSQIDTAIYERREIRRLRQVLGRSVDPRVMEQLLANPTMDILRPERLELTVLYADIRGSTPMAENTDPELFVEFIKDYLTQMTHVILSHEGTVDKFVGDEVMALFGAPIPQEDHALRAVRVGLAMQAAHQECTVKWRESGVLAPPIGIGIVTGRMIVGEMGGAQRSDYTVIGRDANLGARICGVARGGEVLISAATYERVKNAVETVALARQQFKGVARDVAVYQVMRLL